MQDTQPTKYTNKDYKRLGDRIRKDPHNISDDDYRMLQHLRVSYQEPLNKIFTYLEKSAHRVDKNCVCTYRIKRIESIVSKILRFPEMQINRAEDIGGCRCIMTSVEDVYRLYDRLIRNESKFPYEIKGKINDYIQNPKESGYRSIHINVSLQGDTRRIEIQLRCIEQHNWATLVETTDLLYGTKVKEHGQKGDADFFRLHQLLSLPRDSVSRKDMFYIADTIIEYGYLHTLGTVYAQNYLDIRRKWNKMRLHRYHFFLVATDSKGVPEFSAYNNFSEAEKAYFNRFNNNADNCNIVLTHLHNADFAKITMAYSNYFLTFNNIIVRILYYLSQAVVHSYRRNRWMRFAHYYQAFLDIIRFWIEKQQMEIDSYRSDLSIRNFLKLHQDWENSISNGMNAMRAISRDLEQQLTYRPLRTIAYIIKTRKLRAFRHSLATPQ